MAFSFVDLLKLTAMASFVAAYFIIIYYFIILDLRALHFPLTQYICLCALMA